MKEKTNYNRAVQYLSKIAKLVDADWFGGELEGKFTVTVQSTPMAHGHCTVSPVWSNSKGESTYEINVSAETCARPIEEVVATLVHEFTHLHDILNGVQDVSNNGYYHNRKFKTEAEKHGLIIGKHEKYGWTLTECGEDLLRWVIDNQLQEIAVVRNSPYTMVSIGGKAGNGSGAKPTPKRRNTSIKWVCPCCGATVRSYKRLNIVCGDCGEQFIEEE